MKRAEVVLEMDPDVADRASTTTAVVKRLGARSYSLGASASIGGAAAQPKTLRVRVPLTDVQEAIPET